MSKATIPTADPATPAKRDEAALRKPAFREGYPVRLLDGQDWHFPIPFLIFDASADDDDAVVKRWSVGDEYGLILDRMKGAESAEDIARGEMALVKYLLRLNYDLQPADFRGLVAISYAARMPEEFREMVESLRDAIYGRERPKSITGDGSDVP